MKTLRLIVPLFIGCALAQIATAQSTWSGLGADQNWSTGGNWSGGTPTTGSSVTFNDGVFPAITNVAGAVNNIVQSSTTIAGLTFNNNGAANDFVTTLIPSSSILTVAGNLTVGNAAVAVSTAMTGGGSLVAGTGASTLAVQSTSGTATLNLSSLSNFVFNAGGAGGPINLGTSAGGRGTITLAAVSNNIVGSTLSLGNNNTSGNGTLNLGNGTNTLYVDNITMAISKTVGTMQFLNNAGGGLTIANHTGTGRTTFTVSGEGNTGSTGTANNGFLLFNGGTVNILGSTLTLGNRVGRAGASANGSLSFSSGIVDITTINMALNTSPTTSGTDPANATISVGGGTLKIGSGGMSMVNQGGTPGLGALNITNGGTVICSNNIYKSTANGVATITMDSGNLVMASLTGTIGVSNSFAIDNFNVTNSILTLPVATTANIAVNNFNPDAATQNTINVSAMPSITAYPSQFPVISYTTGGGNLNSLVLGAMPSGFSGYISNNVTTLSIDLVVTNGPAAKADQWGGGVNNQWDTASANWTNSGTAVKYIDLDFVTFDDLAQTSTVNLTGTRQPATLAVNNSVLNYTFTGIGRISGPVQLVKSGSGSLTLTESGGDNFSGGIVVNDSGTVILDNTNSAISGGLTIGSAATVQIGQNDANGALPTGNLDNEGMLIFNRSNNLTIATAIPGAGSVTKNGNGILTLTANSAFTGVTTVNAGTLALSGAGGVANSSQVTVNGAGLDVSGVTAAATMTSVVLSNATVTVKVGYLQTNFYMGDLTMIGTGSTISPKTLPAIANYPATVALLRSTNTITGYNFTLGALPAATPAYAGTIALNADSTVVLLTLTAGPIGSRPSVTWNGVDALATGNTNWSDAQNWLTPGVPAATESVTFNNTATAAGSPFDLSGGVGSGGSVDQVNIDNYVDANLATAGLTYGNSGGNYHNTQIASGKTLTVAGSLFINGSAGNVSILGTGGTLYITNNTANLDIEGGTAPVLDLSGLDTFVAKVNQVAVGFDIPSTGTAVSGTWYLARTNFITTGVGSFGVGAAMVIGSCDNQSAAGNGILYLGQTNSIHVDGIVLGAGPAIGDVIAFNPALASSNPVAFIRGIAGDSSRVSLWSLGDATVNLNNHTAGYGHINDFSLGTLNAMVSTLNVGQGSHGNTANAQVEGIFTMGSGRLDVTTLNIGVSGSGGGGTGIGVMSVTNGTVLVNTLGFALLGGGQGTTSGLLGLTNSTLVVSNAVTIGAGTAGATVGVANSMVKLLNAATFGTPTVPLVTLNLDGGAFQLNADGNATAARVVASTINTGAATTINIGSIANVTGPVQIPLISYGSTDPYPALTLGTVPAGYTGATLVDNTGSLSIDLSISPSVNTTPTNITAVVSGGMLTLSWPADHIGWRLQSQTNALGIGLNPAASAWSDVAGAASVNSVNVTPNPASGAVFYRMVYP